MTTRLYYSDSYLTAFDAIVDRAFVENGRTLVVLDRTAFYPTSGGQPFDLGALDGAPVVDVIDRDDGALVHVVERGVESFDAGRRVHGGIDRPRRLDHIQQHTGQHVLSAAFERVCAARTESFHLGADVSTIDLQPEVGPAQIAAAEDDANRVIWENRLVTVRYVSPEDAATMNFRKPPVKTGTLRVIDIEDYDLSACGGTHVTRTGEIGGVAAAGWERFRGGTRVQFVCGGRLVRTFRSFRDVVSPTAQALSVSLDDLPQAVARQQSDNKELRRTAKHLHERLAVFEADALAAGAEPIGGARIVAATVDASDANGLKQLALSITAKPGLAVVLAAPTRDAQDGADGEPLALVVAARSADVHVNAATAIKSLCDQFGGRGGGKPELAQAGGLRGPLADIVAAARRAIAGQLGGG